MGVHGGTDETSIMLHLAPQLVRMELAQDYTPAPRDRRRMGRAALRIPAASPGSVGLPSMATPALGAAIYGRIRQRILERILLPGLPGG